MSSNAHGQEKPLSPIAKKSAAEPAIQPNGHAGAKTSSSADAKPASPKLARSKSPEKKSPGKGLKGFSSNPFALERRKASPPALAHQPNSGKKLETQIKAAPPTQANVEEQEGRVTFASDEEEKPDDRLVPRRSAFSGGPNTLPRMDEETAPEVSMTYKMNKHASTKVIVNPQDETSPLYLPTEKEKILNGAGVYMDVDVKKDLQIRLGGEYQEIEGNHSSQEAHSQGAAVGLRWNF